MTSDLIGTKLGNYRLERMLGRGRMGAVYLAHDEALLRPTAVKILSWLMPEQVGQSPEAWFLSEARNVARINHPNVVQIYGVARHDSHCYIAMEYVTGGSVPEWTRRQGAFSPRRATEVLVQVAGALQAAHDANVVHRDIKPENLLISADGSAKLGDFGMAHYAAGGHGVEVRRVGTPYYTAPEIWRDAPASFSTDIYSLGATYYYLLTGQPPFRESTPEALAAAHLRAPIPDLAEDPSIPEECSELLRRCLAKSPRDRYASARDVAWVARGALRAMHRTAPPATAATTAPAALPSSLLEFFGFTHDPFSTADDTFTPASCSPFAERHTALQQALKADTACVVLRGTKGNGRTALAMQAARDWADQGLVARVSAGTIPFPRLLHQQVARGLGSVESSHGSSGEIDRLLEYLESAERGPNRLPALVVLDDVPSSPSWWDSVNVLVRAAATTQSFKIILIPTEKDGDSNALRTPDAVSLPVEPLTTAQVIEYLSDRRRSALAGGTCELFVTPDAAMLLAERSSGNLSRLNQMVRKMLERGYQDRRRILSSWDAWAASLELKNGLSSTVAARPEHWPSLDVIQILNRERQVLSRPLLGGIGAS